MKPSPSRALPRQDLLEASRLRDEAAGSTARTDDLTRALDEERAHGEVYHRTAPTQ